MYDYKRGSTQGSRCFWEDATVLAFVAMLCIFFLDSCTTGLTKVFGG